MKICFLIKKDFSCRFWSHSGLLSNCKMRLSGEKREPFGWENKDEVAYTLYLGMYWRTQPVFSLVFQHQPHPQCNPWDWQLLPGAFHIHECAAVWWGNCTATATLEGDLQLHYSCPVRRRHGDEVHIDQCSYRICALLRRFTASVSVSQYTDAFECPFLLLHKLLSFGNCLARPMKHGKNEGRKLTFTLIWVCHIIT